MPGANERGLPLTARPVIAIRRIEQITSNEKMNTGYGIKEMSIIIQIRDQKMGIN